MSMPTQKQQKHHESQSAKLRDGQNVLGTLGRAQAEAIHGGQDQNADDTGSLLLGDGQIPELAQVNAKADGECGDASRLDESQQAPAVQEADRSAIGLAQVDIQASRARESGAKFTKGEGAGQAQNAAGNPNQGHVSEGWELDGYRVGDQENAGANYGAGDDGDGVALAKIVKEPDLVVGGVRGCSGHGWWSLYNIGAWDIWTN